MKRPLNALTSLGTAAHHVFELAAGVGLVWQPQLGLRGASGLWGAGLPAWFALAARGSDRWNRLLAFLAGLSLGGVAIHYSLWPWELRRGVPTLTEAEGLRAEQLPAYNALLLGWGLVALAAIRREPPRGARKWAVAGTLAALPMRTSAIHHFEWIREQARSNPAWWNRSLREVS